ncbi:hypothetical protein D3C86_2104150 [compost metagenome]
MGNQLIRRLPCLFLRLAHNDMQPDSEPQRPPLRGGQLAHPVNLLLNLCWRLAPCQIDINMIGRNIHRRIG